MRLVIIRKLVVPHEAGLSVQEPQRADFCRFNMEVERYGSQQLGGRSATQQRRQCRATTCSQVYFSIRLKDDDLLRKSLNCFVWQWRVQISLLHRHFLLVEKLHHHITSVKVGFS